MVERGWGRIVNIGGLAARQTGNLVGTVRNVAVAAMTKNLADELGPRGVNVTVVHPGMTRTERTPEAMAAMAQARGTTVDELERALAGSVALGRLVTAEEVAAVVAFLASPKSVAVNGDPVAAGGGAARSDLLLDSRAPARRPAPGDRRRGAEGWCRSRRGTSSAGIGRA